MVSLGLQGNIRSHRHEVTATRSVARSDSWEATFSTAPDWLRELYLVSAARFGTAQLLRALIEVASHGSEPEQVSALAALASVTGWDARFTPSGEPRVPSEAAAAYASACAR